MKLAPLGEITYGVGLSSICCEYVLLSFVNKDATVAYGRAEKRHVGNSNRDIERQYVELKRHHVTAKGEIGHNNICKPQTL